MKTALSNELFLKQVYDLVGDEYTVLSEYKKSNEYILMRHNTCGHEYEVTPNHFKRGNRCPYCFGRNKESTESFKQKVYDLVGEEYSVLGEYVNTNTKILMKHNTCGHEYEVTPNHFKHGRRCPKCAGNIKESTKSFKQKVYDLVGDEYSVLGEYVNNGNSILMKHNTCGHEWYISPANFTVRNQRCPKCSIVGGKPSRIETDILDYIKIFYTKEIKTSYRGLLDNNQELDMYFPDSKIAIEFDGLYWHSDKFKDKNYHLEKTLECLAKNIQLIHIFEDEWLNKQDIVKSKVKYLLGYSKNLPKIRASKCYIEEISSKDKNTFLNENHIQGEDKSSVKLGLWYPISNEESRLVSVMTFCKPRKSLNGSKKYDYELSRFANDIEYQVYGSFDKLFNYFKDNYEWNSIITYADRRWSKGNLYESTGFKLDHISKPNYWYCKSNNIRYHRFVFRKSELEKKFPDIYNENLTEFEIMNKTDFNRIWDCGNIVYCYKKEIEK